MSSTPKAADLFSVYVSGATLGQVLPVRTTLAGSTAGRLAVDTAPTNAVGAIGWFLADTATESLRRKCFHVRAVSTGVIVLSVDLPEAPQAGDQFRLCTVGANRSATEILALLVDGVQPELLKIPVTEIPGLSIERASGGLGEGVLHLRYIGAGAYGYGYYGYDDDSPVLQIAMNSEAYGEPLAMDVTGGPAAVYNAAKDGFLRVSWDPALLPAESIDATKTLTMPFGTLTANFEAHETPSSGGGVRYWLEAHQNRSAEGVMESATVYLARPAGSATTIATGSSLGLAAGTITVANADGWPLTSFWVRNTALNDLRWIDRREGTTLYCRQVDWVDLTGDGTTTPAVGDVITGTTSGATAIVVSSAAGRATCKRYTLGPGDSPFATGEAAGSLGTLSAVVRGHRDCVAQSWAAGNALIPWADVDLAPVSSPEALTSERQIPSGLTFSAPTADSPLSLGDITSGQWVFLCRRAVILDGITARENADGWVGVNACERWDWE